MMRSTNEWQKRILQFFVNRSGYGRVYRVTTKNEVIDSFGSHIDSNTFIAWMQLETKELIIHCVSGGEDFYTIDFFDKQDEITKIIDDDELDTKSEIMQPSESEQEGLEYHFVTKGFRTNPEQSHYYYYTKQDDESYWICLHKTKPLGRASKIILDSLKDEGSRISRIWKATKTASEDANGEPFRRKRVEDIEPKACGNNRLPSKAAFDIFVYKKWLLAVPKGKQTLYKINSTDDPKSEERGDERK